jgi:hypothetical protein
MPSVHGPFPNQFWLHAHWTGKGKLEDGVFQISPPSISPAVRPDVWGYTGYTTLNILQVVSQQLVKRGEKTSIQWVEGTGTYCRQDPQRFSGVVAQIATAPAKMHGLDPYSHPTSHVNQLRHAGLHCRRILNQESFGHYPAASSVWALHCHAAGNTNESWILSFSSLQQLNKLNGGLLLFSSANSETSNSSGFKAPKFSAENSSQCSL